MRVAILINKAQAERCANARRGGVFRGENVRSNVRELEGALRKILAYRALTKRRSSSWRARRLRDLLSIQNRQISVENIQKTVADYYKIKVADMYSKKRPTALPTRAKLPCTWPKELTQKPAGNRRAVWWQRPHHRAARGTQDCCRTAK